LAATSPIQDGDENRDADRRGRERTHALPISPYREERGAAQENDPENEGRVDRRAHPTRFGMRIRLTAELRAAG
jgi:hypothetical protein